MNYYSRCRGWFRIGVALAALWLIGASAYYIYLLRLGSPISEPLASAFSWVNDVPIPPTPEKGLAGGMFLKPAFSIRGFSLMAIAPTLLIFVAFIVAPITVCWIADGFSPNRGDRSG